MHRRRPILGIAGGLQGNRDGQPIVRQENDRRGLALRTFVRYNNEVGESTGASIDAPRSQEYTTEVCVTVGMETETINLPLG